MIAGVGERLDTRLGRRALLAKNMGVTVGVTSLVRHDV